MQLDARFSLVFLWATLKNWEEVGDEASKQPPLGECERSKTGDKPDPLRGVCSYARPVEPVRLLRFWPDHFSTIIVLIT